MHVNMDLNDFMTVVLDRENGKARYSAYDFSNVEGVGRDVIFLPTVLNLPMKIGSVECATTVTCESNNVIHVNNHLDDLVGVLYEGYRTDVGYMPIASRYNFLYWRELLGMPEKMEYTDTEELREKIAQELPKHLAKYVDMKTVKFGGVEYLVGCVYDTGNPVNKYRSKHNEGCVIRKVYIPMNTDVLRGVLENLREYLRYKISKENYLPFTVSVKRVNSNWNKVTEGIDVGITLEEYKTSTDNTKHTRGAELFGVLEVILCDMLSDTEEILTNICVDNIIDKEQ